MPPPDVGLLLVNLGTPDAPRTVEVRRYLREFLSDPRVLDMPAPLRWLVLNLLILPFRPQRSAEAYAKVSTDPNATAHVDALAAWAKRQPTPEAYTKLKE